MNVSLKALYIMKKYFQAPFSLKDIIIVLIIIGIGLTGAFIGIKLLNIKDDINASSLNGYYFSIMFLIQWTIMMLPMILLTYKKYEINFNNFGIEKVKILEIVKLIVSGYLLYLGISFIVNLLIIYTGIKIPGYQIQEKILPSLGDGTINLVIAGILIVIIAPVLEEIFFRGFLLRTLVNKWGLVLGSIISSALFAVLHLQFGNIIPIFVLGLIINWMVIRSKSILPSIFFHIFNNAIAFTIELLILKEIIKIEEII